MAMASIFISGIILFSMISQSPGHGVSKTKDQISQLNEISLQKADTSHWRQLFNEKGFSVMNCGIKIVDIKSESQTLKVKPGESINLKFN